MLQLPTFPYLDNPIIILLKEVPQVSLCLSIGQNNLISLNMSTILSHSRWPCINSTMVLWGAFGTTFSHHIVLEKRFSCFSSWAYFVSRLVGVERYFSSVHVRNGSGKNTTTATFVIILGSLRLIGNEDASKRLFHTFFLALHMVPSIRISIQSGLILLPWVKFT